jgi:hypothetical protein
MSRHLLILAGQHESQEKEGGQEKKMIVGAPLSRLC